MKLPILTKATLEPGTYPVEFEVGVEGLIGRRVRRWRPDDAVKLTPRAVAFTSLAVSHPVLVHLAFGDDRRCPPYPLRVEGIPVLGDRALPPVGYEVLWQPPRSATAANGPEALVAEAAFDQLGAFEPVPAAPAPQSLPSRSRICIGCAAEVDADEAERTGCCPNCGASWY
jgi:hypothetical protein